jgi:hypothetical protein
VLIFSLSLAGYPMRGGESWDRGGGEAKGELDGAGTVGDNERGATRPCRRWGRRAATVAEAFEGLGRVGTDGGVEHV